MNMQRSQGERGRRGTPLCRGEDGEHSECVCLCAKVGSGKPSCPQEWKVLDGIQVSSAIPEVPGLTHLTCLDPAHLRYTLRGKLLPL